ncbi:MAG: SurA N-terminal domain-containing protein [Puniceicoccales bacterium]|jgi:peptidyl-prolyl cis-trans isomerase D|nr:SurA N-terminal domain-containing protein [Puniceicoccales bacterium]
MISFLQKVLQKHHKWLFSILLAVVTISFVFTVGSSPGIGRNTQGRGKKIFGYDLSSQKNITQLLQEVELSAKLQQIFIGTEQLQSYALLSRLAALKLASSLGFPKPDKPSLNCFIETYPAFLEKNQQFDIHQYNDFLEQINKDPAQLGIFERTVANDCKIAAVEKLLSGQGYCLEIQAQSAILRKVTRYSLLIAQFDTSVLTDDPEYAEDDLRRYFEAHRDAYKMGEQIVLDYIEFPLERFIGNVPEPLPSDLQQIYNSRKNQFQNLAEGSDALKATLTEVYERNMTDHLAMEAATQFTYDLYEKNIARDSEQFKQIIEGSALNVSSLGPIPLEQFSENEYFSKGSLAQVSKLNENRYYSDPIRAKNGNPCILLYQDCIPPIYLPLDSIRERVVQDFLAWKKEETFSLQIDEIRKILGEIQPLSSETFAKIIAEKKGTLVAFDGKNLHEMSIAPQEQEVLLSLRTGSISEVIFTEKAKAEIIFLEKREVPPTIDPATLEQAAIDLERKNKESFNDHIIEMILDEIGVVKTEREEATQHYRMMASLIHMQRH